jgi:hypothetical protein
MNISVHESNNQYYYPGGTAWALGWTSQKLVTAAIVTQTGGTYEALPEKQVKTDV